jgi:hypothetical protein
MFNKATRDESKEHPTCLKRLDSFHLDELASKSFNESPYRGSLRPNSLLSSPGKNESLPNTTANSPRKKVKKLKLESISETDSFGTEKSLD